jgi:PAS domain S-box-containing protein
MFRWIVEAMPEAVVYSDREGIIRLWTRGAETIFGYRREDALGRTLDLIIPERWRAQALGGLSHGHADWRHPIRARGTGGSRQPERRGEFLRRRGLRGPVFFAQGDEGNAEPHRTQAQPKHGLIGRDRRVSI